MSNKGMWLNATSLSNVDKQNYLQKLKRQINCKLVTQHHARVLNPGRPGRKLAGERQSSIHIQSHPQHGASKFFNSLYDISLNICQLTSIYASTAGFNSWKLSAVTVLGENRNFKDAFAQAVTHTFCCSQLAR